jgi:LAO/AO transport system kinase
VADPRAPTVDEAAVEGRANALCDAALAGDRRALARLLTAVENRSPLAEPALRRLYPLAGRAQLIGITGPPGAGKSTLVAALIAELRRAGRPVAVVAVDPSSPITGGALLGDRVRMQAYASDDGVFIRSMASRGHAGGLSSATTAAAAVFDAAGFDVVLIETIGTGQSEVEVAATADTTVVVEAPEMGDEIQAIKAGLLEVADIVVVNKGDRPGAHRTAGQLHAMLADAPRDARPGRPAPKRPEVLVTTAVTGEGVAELVAAVDRHRSAGGGGERDSARLKRAEAQVWGVLADRLHERVRSLEGAGDVPAPGEEGAAAGRPAAGSDAAAAAATSAGDLLRRVASHELDPYEAADAILSQLIGGGPGTESHLRSG